MVSNYFKKNSLFILAVICVITAICLTEYFKQYLYVDPRPLPTTKINTQHPKFYPLPSQISPFTLQPEGFLSNVAILTLATANQPGLHRVATSDLSLASKSTPPFKFQVNTIDFSRISSAELIERALLHPLIHTLITSLVKTVSHNYFHTVYVGFDINDPIFASETVRRAIDTRIDSILLKKDLKNLNILFVPLPNPTHSRTVKMNHLTRIAYIHDPTSTFSALSKHSFIPTAASISLAETPSLLTRTDPKTLNNLFVLTYSSSQFTLDNWTHTIAKQFTRNSIYSGFGVIGFEDSQLPYTPLNMAVSRVHLDLFSAHMFYTNTHKYGGFADGWLFAVYKAWGASFKGPVTTHTHFLKTGSYVPSSIIDVNFDDNPDYIDLSIYLALSVPSGIRPDVTKAYGIKVAQNIKEAGHILWRQVIKSRKRLNMALSGVHYDQEYNGIVDERDLPAVTASKKRVKVPNMPLAFGKPVTAPVFKLVNVFDNCILFESVCKYYAEKELDRKRKNN